MRPDTCPLCHTRNVTEYWPHVWGGAGQTVYRCPGCGVLFLWPRMTETEAKGYYSSYAQHLTKRGVVAHEELPDETFERRKPLLAYRRQAVEPHLKRGGRVLEIGGGCGNFIGELWREGFFGQATLVESCSSHLEYARNKYQGLKCAHALGKLDGGTFDNVVLFHVFEHILDPGEFLAKCGQLLTPEGKICLEVPCSTDPLLSLYDCEAYKNFYFQPMHPYVHCKSSLEHIFGEAGFEACAYTHYQRYPLANHLQWLTHGKPGGNTEYAETLGDACRESYKQAMECNRTTDTLFAVFTQKSQQ